MRTVARISGKSHSYLGKLERGELSPSVETLERLCPIYGILPWEAVAGMTKEELARKLLGPIPLHDPAVQQMLLLAARPDGPAQIREMLALAQSDPEVLRQALLMVEQLRKLNLLKE